MHSKNTNHAWVFTGSLEFATMSHAYHVGFNRFNKFKSRLVLIVFISTVRTIRNRIPVDVCLRPVVTVSYRREKN